MSEYPRARDAENGAAPVPSLRPELSPEPLRQPPQKKNALGILAALGVLFAKFKAFILPALKFAPFLKTGATMILSMAVYAFAFGWRWAVGFVLLIFVHECGHLVVARYFGLKVGAPVFIPFMGAAIALKEAPRNAWIESCVGIGGPIFGFLGSLVCHAAGELLDAPFLIATAYTGYFINMFNLIPISPLDGGRIVTALSPWIWLIGAPILLWFAMSGSIVAIIILVLAIPRVISLFRGRGAAERRYYEVTPTQRWTMGGLYIGLIAALAFGMIVTQLQLAHRSVISTPAYQ